MTNFSPAVFVILYTVSMNVNAATVTAYNTFLEAPQRFGQEAGFGYYGGGQSTSEIIGNSFIPTVTGTLDAVWIAVGSSLADVGSDTFQLYLADSGSENEPNIAFAEATVSGELSKGESVVSVEAEDPDILLEAGTLYWLLIAPGEGTSDVTWLGGPPNAVPGQLFAYLYDESPTGWFISNANANGAMRIDVTTIPLPASLWLFFSGIGMFAGRFLLPNFGNGSCASTES